METSPVIPLEDVLLDHGTSHESLISSKMLQLSLTQYSSINQPISWDEYLHPLVLQRGVLTAEPLSKGRYWHGKKDYHTSQDLPLISLFPYLETQFVASGVHTHLPWGGTLCITSQAPSWLIQSFSYSRPVSHRGTGKVHLWAQENSGKLYEQGRGGKQRQEREHKAISRLQSLLNIKFN